MTNESGNTSSFNSSSPTDAYIGSYISLISKFEIRYEGILYYLNPQDSTLGLKNVRLYGTEGRNKDQPQIPPSDKVYEYILFRGSDIKDLIVKPSPPSQAEEPVHYDPAIIQSYYSGGSSSSSSSMQAITKSSTDFGAYKYISSLNMESGPTILSPHQSGSPDVPWQYQETQNSDTLSYALPTHWHGYNGATSESALQNCIQSTHPSISTKDPLFQASPNLFSTTTTRPYQSSGSTLGPKVGTSNPTYVNIKNSLPTGQLPIASSELHSLPLMSPLPSCPEFFVGDGLAPSLIHSSSQISNNIDPTSFYHVQSSHSKCSFMDSSLVPLLNHRPRLITPNELSHPGAAELSSAPKIFHEHKDVGLLSRTSSNSSSSITSPAAQGPLLPLPPPTQKLHYSQDFDEEFNFEAMNEKFKKDEIWGYLGKSNHGEKIMETEESSTTKHEIEDEGLVTKIETKCDNEMPAPTQPAYKKEEFFDTISRNSLSRGPRNAHNRFYERMKLDTETFGNYQQRFYPSYALYGMGSLQYSWGKGNHCGSRGRGGYMRT